MRYPVPSQAASNVISNQGRHARAEGAGKIKLPRRISFYNRIYRLCRPVIGNRAAIFVAQTMPVLLFAGVPLLAFWLFLAGPTSRGAETIKPAAPVHLLGTADGVEGEGEVMNFREGWRSFVLYAIFFVLLVTGWHELPGDDSILPWYVRLCST